MIELGKDPEACVHTKLKVIVGERFLVTFKNSLPVVALESELTPPAERLSTLMETRRVRKSGDKSHNRLEASVLNHYKDHDAFDALRCKAIVGHYLMEPLYLSTYHIDHVLELNLYLRWLLELFDELIADPSPLLAGEVHALQYWNRPLQHEPLLVHALHTPVWGNTNFLRMLKTGLQHARVWTVRHSEEHLQGGKLDYESMSAQLASHVWWEMESHPIDNLAAERTLAMDCYLTKVLGTCLRVGAREAMVKYSMNVKKAGGGSELDALSKEQLHKVLSDAMRKGRTMVETAHKESARLHKERLPELRARDEQFRVSEEKKAAVMASFAKMREEQREVRCVAAIKLLTAKQVQVQLALRHFLDGVSVRRSGNDKDLRPLLEAQVEAEVKKRAEGGEQQPTEEVEVARLKALGFGPKVAAGGGGERPRKQRADGTAPRKRPAKPSAGDEASGESSSDSDSDSEDSESEEDDDEIDIDELLQKDDDVFKVEKLLEWRWRAGGGREFLVKWEGFSNEETSWEPEDNILEKGMIKKVSKKRAAPGGCKPPPKAKAPEREPEPEPEPTRARSSRTGAQAASEAARRANQQDGESSEEEVSEAEDDEPPPQPAAKKQKTVPPPAPKKPAKRAAPKPAAKPAAKKAAPAPKQTSKAKGKRKLVQNAADFDSSDEEMVLGQRCRKAPRRVPDSSDED